MSKQNNEHAITVAKLQCLYLAAILTADPLKLANVYARILHTRSYENGSGEQDLVERYADENNIEDWPNFSDILKIAYEEFTAAEDTMPEEYLKYANKECVDQAKSIINRTL